MNNKTVTLKDVSVGKRCVICEVNNSLSIKGRLSDLGFRKGALIEKIHIGFSGNPIACRICGAVIAVRSDDAAKISVVIKN